MASDFCRYASLVAAAVLAGPVAGAQQLPPLELARLDTAEHLGTKNVSVARSLLAAANIPIVAEDVGGRRGRKLIVHTDTGDAWVKIL